MKKAATLLALLCIAAFAQQKGTFTDIRDGKTYKTTKIGEQTWMAENLNYEVEGSKCYNDSISYCDKYGRLYDWETAIKACPKGWHLPSKDEWQVLADVAGGNNKAGKNLKAANGWNDYKGNSGNGEDTYGFSALPGGDGYSGGYFSDVGYSGYWWSSSEGNSSSAYYWDMGYSNEYVGSTNYSKSGLHSVRCVMD